MENISIQELVRRVAALTLSQKAITPVAIAEIPLRDEECPEERGDELRLWCQQNCKGRWRHLSRGAPGVVRMGFESAYDAVMFRLAN